MILRWLDINPVQVDDEKKIENLFKALLFLVETGYVG